MTSLFDLNEALLAVISAVLILKASRDETLGSAESRVVGAAIGTAVGLAALAATSLSPVLAVGAAMLVMGGLSIRKPSWRYGLVAAAGVAVASDQGFWDTAQNRGLAILIGATLGVLVGLLVWPETARARALRQTANALSICRELLTDALSAAIEHDDRDVDRLHARFARAIADARETAGAIRLARRGPHRDLVHRTERLWHALIILDRVRETSRSRLALSDEALEHVEALRKSAREALDCAEKLESLPRDCLATLDRERDAAIAGVRPDQEPAGVERAALVFGLGEVARNLREIDEAICAIRKAG